MELVRCELGESQPDREGLQRQVWSEPDWSSSSGCLAIPTTKDTATVSLIALPKESPVLVIQEKGPVSPRRTHTLGVAAFLFSKVPDLFVALIAFFPSSLKSLPMAALASSSSGTVLLLYNFAAQQSSMF